MATTPTGVRRYVHMVTRTYMWLQIQQHNHKHHQQTVTTMRDTLGHSQCVAGRSKRMNIDEYKERVIELIKSGDPKFLESAVECVLYCSESSLEIAEAFDLEIYPEGFE